MRIKRLVNILVLTVLVFVAAMSGVSVRQILSVRASVDECQGGCRTDSDCPGDEDCVCTGTIGVNLCGIAAH